MKFTVYITAGAERDLLDLDAYSSMPFWMAGATCSSCWNDVYCGEDRFVDFVKLS